MQISRVTAEQTGQPFPIHENLVDTLLVAHDAPTGRDPTVAHVLATCAGYAYADADTLATMMARIGLEANACVQLTQVVDAMYIYSTVSLVQSRCGRIVILSYRGTELASIGNWLGDLDSGSETLHLLAGDAVETPRVHAGFYRNFRATRWAVDQELKAALKARSLAEPRRRLKYPMQALFVTGHSLGAAMAVLFALSLAERGANPALDAHLRAVYTFGGPMVIGEPFPAKIATRIGAKIHRHVMTDDPVPTLPPVAWGQFAHFGHEYQYMDGQWQRAENAVAQLSRISEIPKSMLAMLADEKRRASLSYTVAAHGPHHYLAALRPAGRVTEFGDYAAGSI
ncbi:MAG: lipase family protein [Thiobacillus sp.]|uniref:lipase family protein n=1 Tax=Thiobacillus sp. TaxID=924 RepID=UPI002893DBD2|nr:lipase family protein [Thiobacillus sp.]MDT3708465.1 lipase family protein [Thiobacillus sp.]